MLPASVRLVDNHQFRFSQALKPLPKGLKAVEQKVQRLFLESVVKYDLRQVSAATIVMEGTSQEVSAQQKHLNRIARKFRGIAGWGQQWTAGIHVDPTPLPIFEIFWLPITSQEKPMRHLALGTTCMKWSMPYQSGPGSYRRNSACSAPHSYPLA